MRHVSVWHGSLVRVLQYFGMPLGQVKNANTQ